MAKLSSKTFQVIHAAIVTAIVIMVSLMPASSMAAPSWMGAYGSFLRHEGGNPGVFTVLVNDRSSDLFVEVGIRAGAGNWSMHRMTYAGSNSIDSIWRYTPAEPFPAGEVRYFFHLRHTETGDMWDSNGGADYSFTVAPDQPPVIRWAGHVTQWPPDGELDAGEDLWIDAETWPRDAASHALLFYKTQINDVVGIRELSRAGIRGNNDWWHVNLGSFPGGHVIDYWLSFIDHHTNQVSVGSQVTPFTAGVRAGLPLYWIGNTHHWPYNGMLSSQDSLWLNTETWPAGRGFSGSVEYSVEGGEWFREPVVNHAEANNNDLWHLQLGTLPPSSRLYYRMLITDGAGLVHASPEDAYHIADVLGDATDADNDGLPDDWETYWFGSTVYGGRDNPDGDGLMGITFDHGMEWALGTDPSASNDVAAIPLIWQPPRPVAGGLLKLSYALPPGTEMEPPVSFIVEAGITVLAVDAVHASERNRQEAVVVVPSAEELQVAITDARGHADDNRGVRWRIPVVPAGASLPDADGDGLPDAWERAHGLDPFDDGSWDESNGADGDPDGDGRTNDAEWRDGTDPRIPDSHSPDSDHDGLTDEEELTMGLPPHQWNAPVSSYQEMQLTGLGMSVAQTNMVLTAAYLWQIDVEVPESENAAALPSAGLAGDGFRVEGNDEVLSLGAGMTSGADDGAAPADAWPAGRYRITFNERLSRVDVLPIPGTGRLLQDPCTVSGRITSSKPLEYVPAARVIWEEELAVHLPLDVGGHGGVTPRNYGLTRIDAQFVDVWAAKNGSDGYGACYTKGLGRIALPPMDLGSRGTISCRVYPFDKPSRVRELFQADRTDPESFFIRMNAGGGIMVPGGFSDAEPGRRLDAETWHHIVVTWNSTNLSCFLNGQLVHAGSVERTPGFMLNPILGDGADPYLHGWNGKVDDVRVYYSESSESDVQHLMHIGYRRPDSVRIAREEASGLYQCTGIPVNVVGEFDAGVYSESLTEGYFSLQTGMPIRIVVDDNLEDIHFNIHPDADQDGLDDAWEWIHFGSRDFGYPYDDTDRDGLLDIEEYLNGTDPRQFDDYRAYTDPEEWKELGDGSAAYRNATRVVP